VDVSIIVVLTDPANDQHIAFNQQNPSMRVVKHSRAEAIAAYIDKYHPHTIIDVDPREDVAERPIVRAL